MGTSLGTFWKASVAVLCVAAIGASCSSPPMTEAQFGRDMLSRFQAAYPDAIFRQSTDDPLQISVSGKPWKEEAVVNVHRLYPFCKSVPAKDCESEKKIFVSRVAKDPGAPSPERLRLIVRSGEYVDATRKMLESDGKTSKDWLSVDSIGEDLFAILAFDTEQQTGLITRDHLKDLGLTRDQAWTRAYAQTKAILPPLPDPKKLRAGPQVFEGFGYSASLLARLDEWAKVAGAVGPDLFVTAVSDNLVFVGVRPPGPELDRFRKVVAEDCDAQPRCVSPYIFRFRNGRWIIAP
jgi:hypothetical protein